MSLGWDRDPLYESRLREADPIQVLNKSLNKPGPHGNPKTYCMDFDGVLHYHETGSGPGPLGELLGPAIKMAKRIKAAGHQLVILTARPEEQHKEIEGFLRGHGIKVDKVTNKKPPAEFYIDDRAIPWPRNAGHKNGIKEGGPGSGPRKRSQELAQKFVNLHNAASKEYKAAFAAIGAKMWHDDAAHPLKDEHRDYIAEQIERIGPKTYRIERPLTVMDSYPEAHKHTAKLDKAVDAIHQKYTKLWNKERSTKESFRERLFRFGESVLREGGSGSGNFGHSGRPGEVGGAGAGGGEAPQKKERKRGYKIGEKYGLAGMKPGFKVEMAQSLFGKHYKELSYGDKQKVKQALRARGVIRPKGTTEAHAGEKELKEAAVISTKNLGGGINETKTLELEGGIKAVFKVASMEKDAEKETAAWKIAKLVGLEDIVPPVVMRKIGDQEGCVMKFWDGKLASKVFSEAGYGDQARKAMFDGDMDLHRAAAFDFIIGNSDRHANNWLVGHDKLQLIDHGLAFPARDFGLGNANHSQFAREVVKRESREPDKVFGKYEHPPSEFAKPYVDKKEEILSALKDLGLRQESVEGVRKRINALANAIKWKDLENIGRANYEDPPKKPSSKPPLELKDVKSGDFDD